MRLGGTWKGADGTDYTVIMPKDVEVTQPRWFVDVAPAPGDTMLGPASPARLHLIPEKKCGDEIRFALVLP